MKQYYVARWLSPSLTQLGNVSFMARSTAEAIKKADRIGRDIGLPKSARTIHRDLTLIHEKPYVA